MQSFCLQFIPVSSVVVICFYIFERESRMRFLQKKQIESLMKEQKKVFDLLPEGLVIHSRDEDTNQSQINYLNQTFRQMFTDKVQHGQSFLMKSGK